MIFSSTMDAQSAISYGQNPIRNSLLSKSELEVAQVDRYLNSNDQNGVNHTDNEDNNIDGSRMNEIQAELELTHKQVLHIRDKIKEDIENQTNDTRKEKEKETMDQFTNKMQTIYVSQIDILHSKIEVLEGELRYQNSNLNEKIQMLEDQNEHLVRDLQDKSRECSDIRAVVAEYKEIAEENQEAREKNNNRAKFLSEGYALMEAEYAELKEKCEYFERKKNIYKKGRNNLRESQKVIEDMNLKQKEVIDLMRKTIEEQIIQLERKEELHEQILRHETALQKQQEYISELQSNQLILQKQNDEDNEIIQQYESNLNQIEAQQDKFSSILEEKTQNEKQYIERIQQLEGALDTTNSNIEKLQNSSTKQKKKISELQNSLDTNKVQLEKYTKNEIVQMNELKAIVRIFEKYDKDQNDILLPSMQDCPTIISYLRNIATKLQKDLNTKETTINKKTEQIVQISLEKDTLDQEIILLKENLKEKEAATKKNNSIQLEQINNLNNENSKLLSENKQIKRALNDLNFESYKEMTKDRESVIYQQLAMRMMNYCGFLHWKVAQLRLVKNIAWSLGSAYMESAEIVLKQKQKLFERTEAQENIKKNAKVLAKNVKKQLLVKVLRKIMRSVFFIALLKIKKNTRVKLSQGLICNWINSANRINMFQQQHKLSVQEELLKNPDKFIAAMNSTSDVLSFRDSYFPFVPTLRQQLLNIETHFQKCSQTDREQIDFINLKVKDISAQTKIVLDSRKQLEEKLQEQIFINKSQLLTIQQLQGELTDQQFELKLSQRIRQPPTLQRSLNSSQYLK